jgi:hypothetical protein
MMAKALTAHRVRELFDYDCGSGSLTRKAGIAKHKAGEVAGSVSTHGHTRVGVDGKSYYAHRLVWLHVYGAWPQYNIDHIDGDPSNNRIENLRDVTQELNNQNQLRAHHDNSQSLLGVSFVKAKGKFRASLTVNKKPRFLGYFDTAEEAREKYVSEKRIHHPGCTL